MNKVFATVALVVALLVTGCLGSSTAGRPSSHPASEQAPSSSATQGLSTGTHPVVDSRTRHRLLAEWRVAVKTAQVMYGPRGGIGFLPPRQLASAMRRANPTIPVLALTTGSGPKSSLVRYIFVVPTSNVHRLDIAAVAANGYYVHLVAVDRHAPLLRARSLVRGGV
jgi:hypothetical protein